MLSRDLHWREEKSNAECTCYGKGNTRKIWDIANDKSAQWSGPTATSISICQEAASPYGKEHMRYRPDFGMATACGGDYSRHSTRPDHGGDWLTCGWRWGGNTT